MQDSTIGLRTIRQVARLPHPINTASEARELVRACKYPPRGIRSLSRVTHAALIHGPDYNARANESTNVFAIIETAEGMANLDDITMRLRSMRPPG